MTQPTANPERGKEVFATDRAHVFHSWSAQSQIAPLPVAGGEGSYFWDFDGKKYLDFSCQLVFTNIGFQHPKVIKAIQEQAGMLTTVAPQHANEARGEAAKRITARAGAQGGRHWAPVYTLPKTITAGAGESNSRPAFLDASCFSASKAGLYMADGVKGHQSRQARGWRAMSRCQPTGHSERANLISV